jgi:hypothetical protein
VTRTRATPRISITKVAEYLVATAGRRQTILRDQKYPPAFKAGRFRDAYLALGDILVAGSGVRGIDAQIAEWRSRVPSKRFQAECLANCIDALTAFKAFVARGDFAGMTFVPGVTGAYRELGGVDLSARPEVLIGGGSPGAMKIYLGKTSPLTEDVRGRPGSSSYAATALNLWAEKTFSSALPERSIVVDVFAGKIFRAPKSQRNRRADILAACQEIAVMWNSVRPQSRAA